MTLELLQTWLKLPNRNWPPDHYTLLGMVPGQGNNDEIEHRVLERMDWLRRYQLLHPDLVTEGMNRLAQAMDCLTDAKQRKDYDRKLGINSSVVIPALNLPDMISMEAEEPSLPEAALIEIPLPARTQVTEVQRPTSVVVEEDEDDEDEVDEENEEPEPIYLPTEIYSFAQVETKSSPVVETVSPIMVDVVEEEAPSSSKSRVSTDPEKEAKRLIYAELAMIRRVLRVWTKIRAFLDDPENSFSIRTHCIGFMACLAELKPHLDSIREWVGLPDQPGYLVCSLAKQPLRISTFQTILPSQREALAQDARIAHFKLVERYTQRRAVAESFTKEDLVRDILVPLWRYLRRYPEFWLMLLSLLALMVALTRQ